MKSQQTFIANVLQSLILLAILLSWSATSIIAAPANQEGPIYIIQQGDTLNSIALRFGISPDTLAAANSISDPNALFIGQELVIPGLEGISGILTAQTLPFGASLNGLIRKYQLKADDLTFLNRLASPTEAIAGVKFIIPINQEAEPLSPLAAPDPGQTLLEFAVTTGASPWHLVENNRIQGTWDILPGETLYAENPDQDKPDTLYPEPISAIILNNLPIIQGETLHISINTSTPVTLKGKFGDQDLHFFTEDDQIYHTFHGVHALAEPGPIPLEISVNLNSGQSISFQQLVMLAEGGYGNEWVNVPEEYLDESVIAEEDAYLQPILDKVSPQRHWDGKFIYPVDEPCINSPYGQRRDYNNGGLFFYHTGMDFAVCAQNLNIYAPAAGEVVLAEELVIKGKAVLIDHGWGVFSGYWHLEEFNVQVGDLVEPGDVIGLIGNSGRSAGPHLHFEIDITGTPVNPMTWLDQEFPASIED